MSRQKLPYCHKEFVANIHTLAQKSFAPISGPDTRSPLSYPAELLTQVKDVWSTEWNTLMDLRRICNVPQDIEIYFW